MPGTGRRDGKTARREPLGRAVGLDPGSFRGRIDRARLVAQGIEHDLLPVVELETEPVPAHLVLRQRAGAEFMVEPAQAGNGAGFIAHPQAPLGGQARIGIVVGGVARPSPFRLKPSTPSSTSGLSGRAVKSSAISPLGRDEPDRFVRSPAGCSTAPAPRPSGPPPPSPRPARRG